MENLTDQQLIEELIKRAKTRKLNAAVVDVNVLAALVEDILYEAFTAPDYLL